MTIIYVYIMQSYSRQQFLPETMYIAAASTRRYVALDKMCRRPDFLTNSWLATVHVYLLLHIIEFFCFFRNLSLGCLGSLCTLRLSFLGSLLLGLELLQSLFFRLHLSNLLRSGGLRFCLLLRLNLALFLCKFLSLLGGLLGLPFCNLLLLLGLLTIYGFRKESKDGCIVCVRHETLPRTFHRAPIGIVDTEISTTLTS